jgi:hypothetical protein
MDWVYPCWYALLGVVEGIVCAIGIYICNYNCDCIVSIDSCISIFSSALMVFDGSIFETSLASSSVVFMKEFKKFRSLGNSFQDALGYIKDRYYLANFGRNDAFRSNSKVTLEGNYLTLFGLEFGYKVLDGYLKFNDRGYGCIEIVCIVDSIFRYVNSINKRGYVTEKCLDERWMNSIVDFLTCLGYTEKQFGNAELPYTMWYNWIFIHAYYVIIKCIKELKLDCSGDWTYDDKEELVAEMECLRDELLSRVDHYLRIQIQKRGITVMQNTYTGFDTEYVTKDEVKNLNEIVSAQTAVQERTIIKIPLYHEFNISHVNPLSSEISDVFSSKVNSDDTYKYSFTEVVKVDEKDEESGKSLDDSGYLDWKAKKNKEKNKLNEIFLINEGLKDCIGLIRKFLFGGLYDVNGSLIQKLKDLKDLKVEGSRSKPLFPEFADALYFEDLKRDQFVFAMPLLPMRTEISFDVEEFSFDDLFEMARDKSTEFFCEGESEFDTDKLLQYFDSFSLPKIPGKTFKSVVFDSLEGASFDGCDGNFVTVNEDAMNSNNNSNSDNNNNNNIDINNELDPFNFNASEDGTSDSFNHSGIDSFESSIDCSIDGSFDGVDNSYFDGSEGCIGYQDGSSEILCESNYDRGDNTSLLNKTSEYQFDKFRGGGGCPNNLDPNNLAPNEPTPNSTPHSSNTNTNSNNSSSTPTSYSLENASNSLECSTSLENSTLIDSILDVEDTITNTNTNTNTITNTTNITNTVKEDKEVKEVKETINYKPTNLTTDLILLLKLLHNTNFNFLPLNLFKWYKTLKVKPRGRTHINYNNDGNEVKIPISIVKNFYIIGHYNSADLTMITNFDEELKTKLSIVNKSFVSLGKPLKFNQHYVYVRDTILLAPGGYGSLSKIGKLYQNEGDFAKREVSQADISDMKSFLKKDKIAFEEYAVQDAIITLKHATAMEKFNMSVKQVGIPLTLSSIGRNYVLKEWTNIFKKYIPYQISGNFLMGNTDEIQTPKGLFASRDVGAHLSYYIANYKGGRNESFMYGVDENTQWFDYDLTSAYTTGMTLLTLPDYFKGSLINPQDLASWNVEDFLNGYLIVNADFNFPEHIKYPSIPCFVDKTTTVYPLSGTAFLTGPEYWLALRQGCEMNIKSAFYIHPKTKNVKCKITKEYTLENVKPFHNILKDLQSKRREFPKGTVENALYKEIGNGIYGNLVRGMSNKKSFDSTTGKYFRIAATELSNPILGSWTTAFIRTVIGECLHNIQTLGGKIVSVTTDGFITDIENLEEKLLTLPEEDTKLLRKYRDLRLDLTDGKSPEGLELKTGGKGVISWTTRGQLGIEKGMKATTGFQTGDVDRKDLVSQFKNILSSKDKYADFVRKSLRGAKDIFEKGGHVARTFKDQVFRLHYDNRRRIIEPHDFKYTDSTDLSNKLLDSQPLENINKCKTLRFLAKFPTTKPFNKNNANKAITSYKSSLEIGIRNFIKAYYCKNKEFGFKGNEFKNVKSLIDFIYGEVPAKSVKITIHSISKIRNRKLFWKLVPPTKENLKFIDYVKKNFPHFKEELFFSNN